MSSRRFINDPDQLLNAGLASIPLLRPGIGLDVANKILYIRPRYKSNPKQCVSLISGGGSGHEPSFGGMVGPGMLSAAVAGTIFASPSAEQVRTAIISRVDNNGFDDGPEAKPITENNGNGDKGALVIVMNYTGDVLNFGVGVEMARAAGANATMVVVGDDVAVSRSTAGKVGRRGLAGTVLVHKISGALAYQGLGLSQVAKAAQTTASNLATIGVTLDQVTVPGVRVRKEVGELDRDPRMVEIGMGIHNEPGWSREALELDDIIEQMLSRLLERDDPQRSFVDFISDSPSVVLLVNNLGGLGALEFGAITTQVVRKLEQRHKIRPVRIYSGIYMTSLDAKGFSITLLRIVDLGIASSESMLTLLDHSCEASGWSGNACLPGPTWEANGLGIRESDRPRELDLRPSHLHFDAKYASKMLASGLQAIVANEPDITRFDLAVGDGDCGTTLKRGAESVLHFLDTDGLSGDAVVDTISIARVVGQTMDGTSGAIYALFLNALSTHLRSLSSGVATVRIWSRALQQSADVLGQYTPAKLGDRTLIDALHPFISVLERTGDISRAAAAALESAKATQGMRASLGRTVYIGGSAFERVPDPGAWGLANFFVGLASTARAEK